MLNFIQRNKSKQLHSAVVPQQFGLAIATVNHEGSSPTINCVDFTYWDSNQVNEKLLLSKVKQLGLINTECSTCMDLGDYAVLSVEAPQVPNEELLSAVRWQIKDLIDFHIDDAVLDVFDAPASGADGKQRNVYVVVSRVSHVRERVDFLQTADLNLDTIDIPELVLRNVTAQLPEDESGVALIYLTRDKGLIILTKQKTLFLARSLEIGTDSLQDADVDRTTFDVNDMIPEYDRLTLEVQRSIDYYDRYFGKGQLAGIVLAPVDGEIPGLVDYLSFNLGLNTRLLDLNESLQTNQQLTVNQQANCLLAIGAALRKEQKQL